ncbi:integrase [Pseudomonas alkylphenolica]|uniref:Integrase n=1 Tax=Pseudomonas alkylphenolica TaxID=237609 RepID=A0A443ZZS6_9PSED|nr:tyrosine-type recombinase/integrase [Pseudomonas alkylphenolica]RWU26750.1 integrase [Pseudomonas alkylphenolica]
MGETRYIDFSDAAIRAEAKDEYVRDLRDHHYPDLRFRYLKDRRRGAWYTVHDGKWQKAADWPRCGCKEMDARLSSIQLLRTASDRPDAVLRVLYTVGDVVSWYLERHLNAATISKSRKASCRSLAKNWLLPRLVGMPVDHLNTVTLDRLLVQPMQAQVAPATVCNAYRMLSAAFRTARRLGLLNVNPLADVRFTDFGLGRLRPKGARLFPRDVGWLMDLLTQRLLKSPGPCMLALLMLGHGTRIGETRQARWDHFDLNAGWWVIPAELTKTRTRLELPLTPAMMALIRWYKAQQNKPSVYLFPGGHGHALTGPGASLAIASLSTGAWSSHDLRKLARAGWQHLNVNYVIAEQLLNHAMPGLTETYVQGDLSALKRQALEVWHGVGTSCVDGLDLARRFDFIVNSQ